MMFLVVGNDQQPVGLHSHLWETSRVTENSSQTIYYLECLQRPD